VEAQFHKRLDRLIQFPGEHKSNSVHIVCQEFSDPLLFDVHFEQKKVLEDLSYPCALVFFQHYLIFIGQRKYPSEAEAVAIVLQRRVAKIEEGKDNKITHSVLFIHVF